MLDRSDARLFYLWGYLDTHDGFVSANLMYEDQYNYPYPYNYSGPTKLKFTDDRHGCVTVIGDGIIKSKDDPCREHGGGYVLITNDGGETWEYPIHNNGMEPDHQVFSVDGVDTTFYVTSDRGIVYKRCLVNGPQSVMEGASPEGITVNPTLTDGVVTVSGESLVELQVYNTLGQRVLTLQPSESIATIDLTGQPAGLYFVSVTDRHGQRCVKKIVKQ